MLTKAQREAVRRHYRLLRIAVNKTQFEVEREAKLLAGRYWKIENGVIQPDASECKALARVLKVAPSDLPCALEQAS